MIKISGIDKFSQQLQEAQRALSELDSEIGSVTFDVNDPESIESAIKNMEHMIDSKTERYGANPLIGPLIEKMKQEYRQGIIEKAAAERLKDDNVG